MTVRILLLCCGAVWLTGCGNCNILSGGNLPASCEAGLAVGAVVLAPVAIPMAMADDAKARSGSAAPSKEGAASRPDR